MFSNASRHGCISRLWWRWVIHKIDDRTWGLSSMRKICMICPMICLSHARAHGCISHLWWCWVINQICARPVGSFEEELKQIEWFVLWCFPRPPTWKHLTPLVTLGYKSNVCSSRNVFREWIGFEGFVMWHFPRTPTWKHLAPLVTLGFKSNVRSSRKVFREWSGSVRFVKCFPTHAYMDASRVSCDVGL